MSKYFLMSVCRVWSISLRRLLRKALLDSTARCVNWSPDGSLLIIGLGGAADGTRQRKDGAYLIIDGETLKPIFEGRYILVAYTHIAYKHQILSVYRDSRHWIRDIKFSPDGKSFALASMDHKIYLYHLDGYRLRGLCEKHNSYIYHFDFSADGKFIQSDSADYEHLYFETNDGAHYSIGSNLVLFNDSSYL
jgi:WD40 repeat protein